MSKASLFIMLNCLASLMVGVNFCLPDQALALSNFEPSPLFANSKSDGVVINSLERQILSRDNKKRKKKPQCRDGKDNDHDGLVDYPADPGCKNRRDNKERNAKVVSPINVGLNGQRPFPDDNAWNLDISGAQLDPNSDNLIASIGMTKGLHPDFGTVYEGKPIGIPYVVVSNAQPLVKITSFLYDDESDHALYPIPSNAPIEGGSNADGDRHVIVVDKDNWMLYELYNAFPDGQGWRADSGAIFDLSSNNLRPAGWTSADAAGLPIFPGLVRYDEVVEKGEINHALRFTVKNSRRAYVSPARHYASSKTSLDLPPMGMRVRLKADFDISGFPQKVQVVLKALKKYGMFVADNGSDWFISGAPDSRWNDDELAEIRNVKGSDFEVVKMEGIVTE